MSWTELESSFFHGISAGLGYTARSCSKSKEERLEHRNTNPRCGLLLLWRAKGEEEEEEEKKREEGFGVLTVIRLGGTGIGLQKEGVVKRVAEFLVGVESGWSIDIVG